MRSALFLFLVFLVLCFPSPARGGNQCVECHRKLASSATPAHNFGEWKESVHARKGVTCEKCHGGNPGETDPQKAHRGLLKSNHPESPLYFSRIPETCGSCHTSELEEFQKSYHYKELKRSGRGPNCLTCHGSMAMTILKPKHLDQSCSLCHLQKERGSEALVTLNLAGQALHRWKSVLTESRTKGLASPEREKALQEGKDAYQEAQRKWHSFELQEVIRRSRDLVNRAKKETELVRLRKEKK